MRYNKIHQVNHFLYLVCTKQNKMVKVGRWSPINKLSHFFTLYHRRNKQIRESKWHTYTDLNPIQMSWCINKYKMHMEFKYSSFPYAFYNILVCTKKSCEDFDRNYQYIIHMYQFGQNWHLYHVESSSMIAVHDLLDVYLVSLPACVPPLLPSFLLQL